VICVLQFDAASVSLLDRMLAAGDLPNLQAAVDRGRRVELETPAKDFAAGAFYSLYSGVSMGEHGIFYPFQWSAPDSRARYATAFEAPPPVWERLAGSGIRTLAIDPYESRPPARDGVEGTFVCGWGFVERVVLPRWSHPARVGRKLERRHGRGAPATEVFGEPSVPHLLSLREGLLRAPARIATLAREELATEDYDLAWLTFSASHMAGHAFWDLSLLDEDALDPAARDLIAGALPEIYSEVDRAIGAVIEALPAGTDVIVASAVGMEENTSRADLVPQMLGAIMSGERLEPDEGSGASGIWKLRGAVPGHVRARIAATIPRRVALELTSRLELRGYDWSTTRAFAHPADNQGYIRFNLAGRERNGIVTGGAEADELAAEITEGMLSFRLEDGSPAATEVVRTEELATDYGGAHAHRLPDLVVRWSERPTVRDERLHSERFGTAVRYGAGSGRSGNHPAGGAWAVLAPGSGVSPSDPGRAPRVEDVAATVLELLGAEPERRAGIAGATLLG
jgi:predicted AlkP superfamily phosphohydrolase/phosphomutase